MQYKDKNEISFDEVDKNFKEIVLSKSWLDEDMFPQVKKEILTKLRKDKDNLRRKYDLDVAASVDGGLIENLKNVDKLLSAYDVVEQVKSVLNAYYRLFESGVISAETCIDITHRIDNKISSVLAANNLLKDRVVIENIVFDLTVDVRRKVLEKSNTTTLQ